MSSTQNTASPRGPRPKPQHSKSATQPPPNTGGKQTQRRQKGSHVSNGQNNSSGLSPSKVSANAQEPTFTDGAAVSSEELQIPTGPRNAKKHIQSQPSSDRILSPTNIPTAALTDPEKPPVNPSATPAKAQGAYAGPTFHASPAPSTLPIPKFLSKSVPAKPRAGPPTPPDEGSDSAGSPTPSPPSPSRDPIPVPPRHEDSPLDMLFKADRAEKARNTNSSPAPATFGNSPRPSAVTNPKHHSKQDSHTSLNAMFPIELDAESKTLHTSPPIASPITHRSITAPSRIPQVDSATVPATDSAAIQDLLSRLSQSQKKPIASTPPRHVDHVPSEPSSRHQTPSPFFDGKRSASGPTTPAPPVQRSSSDFFYGNRNLSPLFQAAKTDATMRNSGLRTEVTADSPLMAQGAFPPITPKVGSDTSTRNYMNSTFGDPTSPRRGSAPQVQPITEMPNNRRQRTPGRRSYHPRPDSYPHANSNGVLLDSTSSSPKPKTNPFIPASVQAKQYPTTATKPPDPLSLEQDLKRMLNLNVNGDTTGVR